MSMKDAMFRDAMIWNKQAEEERYEAAERKWRAEQMNEPKTTGGLMNIYDALARQDADIYIAHGDKRLYFSGKYFTVLRCDDLPPIPLIQTESEAAAVNVLTGHFQALGEPK